MFLQCNNSKQSTKGAHRINQLSLQNFPVPFSTLFGDAVWDLNSFHDKSLDVFQESNISKQNKYQRETLEWIWYKFQNYWKTNHVQSCTWCPFVEFRWVKNYSPTPVKFQLNGHTTRYYAVCSNQSPSNKVLLGIFFMKQNLILRLILTGWAVFYNYFE